jgi:hypothetical protein
VHRSKKDGLSPATAARLSVASAELSQLNRPHGYKRLITPRKDVDEERPRRTSDNEKDEREGNRPDDNLADDLQNFADLPPMDLSSIDRVHLEALMTRFNAADVSGEGLDKDAFVSCFASVLSDMSADKLVSLFMKIDANSDGTVTWEEFASYM